MYSVSEVGEEFRVMEGETIVFTFSQPKPAEAICKAMNVAYKSGRDFQRQMELECREMDKIGMARVELNHPVYRELSVLLPGEEVFYVVPIGGEWNEPIKEWQFFDRHHNLVLTRQNMDYYDHILKQ